MPKVKFYGCYDPTGKICIAYSKFEVESNMEGMPKDEVDDYYAERLDNWTQMEQARGYDLMRILERQSSIMFCQRCPFLKDVARCRSYRKRERRRVFT